MLLYNSTNYDDLVNTLETESNITDWFHSNCMQANPETFQAIAVVKQTKNLQFYK